MKQKLTLKALLLMVLTVSLSFSSVSNNNTSNISCYEEVSCVDENYSCDISSLQISGATTVMQYSTHTYTADSPVGNCNNTWHVRGGTIISQNTQSQPIHV